MRVTLRAMRLSFVVFWFALFSTFGCSTPAMPDADSDAGLLPDVVTVDAPVLLDAPEDAGTETLDVAPDAPTSCLTEHSAGERYSAGDACNFCDCNADGTSTCTARTCPVTVGAGCEYAGTMHGYAERFPATDGCNECVCAASGLACTRRACATSDEGAILLESPNAPCGDDASFTAANVFGTLPVSEFDVPFLYDRARASYAEVLPDTTLHMRLVFDDGFIVCRLPSIDQPAIDVGITIEWITEDGAFDEGIPAYLRRNNFGFVDSWEVLGSVPLGALNGTYRPVCSLDPGGYVFSASIEPDGHANGGITRSCETDLSFTVGSFDRPAP